MRHRPVILILIGVALLAACRRGAPPAAPAPSFNPVATTERLYYDNGGGIQEALQLVIRDAATLADVWRRATSRQVEPPPVPQIDFTREMLVLVAAGRMTPQDEIRVDSVGIRSETTATGRTERVMDVIVRIREGCRRFNADAYPLEVVRVRRFDGPVNFVERREQATDCRDL